MNPEDQLAALAMASMALVFSIVALAVTLVKIFHG